jgi:hypothetical protein
VTARAKIQKIIIPERVITAIFLNFHEEKRKIGIRKKLTYTENQTKDHTSLAHQTPTRTRNQNGKVINIQRNIAAVRRSRPYSILSGNIFIIDRIKKYSQSYSIIYLISKNYLFFVLVFVCSSVFFPYNLHNKIHNNTMI